jgi:tripartite-type tricarboxylate transporter receptor subunit TctC
MRNHVVALLGAAALLAVPLMSAAQDYPAKVVRIVTAYAPGGASDIVARTVATRLSELWRKQVIVENRPGGSGLVGAMYVRDQPGDGYTLALGTTTTHVINPLTLPTAKFDPLKDFEPVTPIAIAPYLLAVHSSIKVRSTSELIQLAKSQPGKLNYGSSGTSIYLATELFKSMAGIDAMHIPYKGGGPALTALLANEVQLIFDPLPSAAFGHAKSGTVIPLATSGLSRPRVAADLPTIAESGLPGFDVSSWYGLFAPAGTPRNVVATIAASVARVVSEEDVRQKLADLGAEPNPMAPHQFYQLVRRDQDRWAKLIQDRKLRLDQYQ